MAKKLKKSLLETDAFEYPEGLKTKISHVQLSIEDPIADGLLNKARERQAAKFGDHEEKPQQQSWLTKLLTSKPEI